MPSNDKINVWKHQLLLDFYKVTNLEALSLCAEKIPDEWGFYCFPTVLDLPIIKIISIAYKGLGWSAITPDTCKLKCGLLGISHTAEQRFCSDEKKQAEIQLQSRSKVKLQSMLFVLISEKWTCCYNIKYKRTQIIILNLKWQ